MARRVANDKTKKQKNPDLAVLREFDHNSPVVNPQAGTAFASLQHKSPLSQKEKRVLSWESQRREQELVDSGKTTLRRKEDGHYDGISAQRRKGKEKLPEAFTTREKYTAAIKTQVVSPRTGSCSPSSKSNRTLLPASCRRRKPKPIKTTRRVLVKNNGYSDRNLLELHRYRYGKSTDGDDYDDLDAKTERNVASRKLTVRLKRTKEEEQRRKSHTDRLSSARRRQKLTDINSPSAVSTGPSTNTSSVSLEEIVERKRAPKFKTSLKRKFREIRGGMVESQEESGDTGNYASMTVSRALAELNTTTTALAPRIDESYTQQERKRHQSGSRTETRRVAVAPGDGSLSATMPKKRPASYRQQQPNSLNFTDSNGPEGKNSSNGNRSLSVAHRQRYQGSNSDDRGLDGDTEWKNKGGKSAARGNVTKRKAVEEQWQESRARQSSVRHRKRAAAGDCPSSATGLSANTVTPSPKETREKRQSRPHLTKLLKQKYKKVADDMLEPSKQDDNKMGNATAIVPTLLEYDSETGSPAPNLEESYNQPTSERKKREVQRQCLGTLNDAEEEGVRPMRIRGKHISDYNKQTPLLPPDFLDGVQTNYTAEHSRKVTRAAYQDPDRTKRRRLFLDSFLYRNLIQTGYLVIDGPCDLDLVASCGHRTSFKVRDAPERVEMMRSLQHLCDAMPTKGNVRTNVGDLGEMYALGYRRFVSDLKYVTTHKPTIAKELRRSGPLVRDYMTNSDFQQCLKQIEAAERKSIRQSQLSPSPELDGSPSKSVMVTKNLGNASHYDWDSSPCCVYFLERRPGTAKNWSFILPNVRVACYQGVVVQLRHARVLQWDGRYVRHCTRVTVPGKDNDVFGVWYGCCIN